MSNGRNALSRFGAVYFGMASNSAFNGMGSLIMDIAGQFASVLLKAPSSSSSRAVAQALVLISLPSESASQQ